MLRLLAAWTRGSNCSSDTLTWLKSIITMMDYPLGDNNGEILSTVTCPLYMYRTSSSRMLASTSRTNITGCLGGILNNVLLMVGWVVDRMSIGMLRHNPWKSPGGKGQRQRENGSRVSTWTRPVVFLLISCWGEGSLSSSPFCEQRSWSCQQSRCSPPSPPSSRGSPSCSLLQPDHVLYCIMYPVSCIVLCGTQFSVV